MEVLKGSGHFAVGFLIGYLVFWIVLRIKPGNWNLKIWGPFLPHAFGTIAAFPYSLELIGYLSFTEDSSWGWNLFLFYKVLHGHRFFIAIFNSFLISMATIAFIYLRLVLYYINLIKQETGRAK